MKRIKQSAIFVPLACLVLAGGGVASSVTYGIGDDKKSEKTQVEYARNEKKKELKETEKKQKTCQNREANIKAMLVKTNERTLKQIEVFNKIAERTQEFYAKRGKVLDTYEPLVSDVTTKKAVAEQTAASLKNISEAFTCTGDNPQNNLKIVRAAVKENRDAMKAYKTSIKQLIVGVKSIQSTAKDATKKRGDQ